MNRLRIYLFIILLSSLAFIRPINPDEPYYSNSSHELLTGNIPYVDFLFHQMPFMLLVYTPVSWNGYWSLIAGRMLSYLLYLLSLYLIYKNLSEFKGPGKRIVFIIFFLTYPFLLNWIFIIKIYALAILLLVSGSVLLNKFFTSNDNDKAFLYVFGIGLIFSVLFLTRVVFAVTFIPLIIFIYYITIKKKLNIIKILFALFAGSAAPLFIFFLLFRNHLFDIYLNVVYVNNLVRADEIENFGKSFFEYLFVFLIRQCLIFLIIIFVSGKKFSLIEKFFIFNIVLFLVLHIFTQMFNEYLIPVIPLIIILAYNRFELFVEKAAGHFRLNKKLFTISFIILFILLSPFSIPRLSIFFSGNTSDTILTTPVEMYNVSKKLNDFSGNSVLSNWELYSFYTNKEPLMKNEYVSGFLRNMNDKLYPEISSKAASNDDYKKLIINKIPDVIIYDTIHKGYFKGMYNDISINYELVDIDGIVKFYKKKN